MFVRNFFDTIQTERAEPCSEGTEQTERGRGVDNREIINETLVHLFHEIQKLEEEAIITEDFKDLTNNDINLKSLCRKFFPQRLFNHLNQEKNSE